MLSLISVSYTDNLHTHSSAIPAVLSHELPTVPDAVRAAFAPNFSEPVRRSVYSALLGVGDGFQPCHAGISLWNPTHCLYWAFLGPVWQE